MPAIAGIAHIEVSVSNLDASVSWYCVLLGAEEVFRDANETERIRAAALLEKGSGMVFALTEHREHAGRFDVRRSGLDHVAFAVSSLDELERWAVHLDSLGIPHSGIKDYGYANALTCADPDGIALEFFQSKRQPRPA